MPLVILPVGGLVHQKVELHNDVPRVGIITFFNQDVSDAKLSGEFEKLCLPISKLSEWLFLVNFLQNAYFL